MRLPMQCHWAIFPWLPPCARLALNLSAPPRFPLDPFSRGCRPGLAVVFRFFPRARFAFRPLSPPPPPPAAVPAVRSLDLPHKFISPAPRAWISIDSEDSEPSTERFPREPPYNSIVESHHLSFSSLPPCLDPFFFTTIPPYLFLSNTRRSLSGPSQANSQSRLIKNHSHHFPFSTSLHTRRFFPYDPQTQFYHHHVDFPPSTPYHGSTEQGSLDAKGRRQAASRTGRRFRPG